MTEAERMAEKWDIGSRASCRCDGCIAILVEGAVAAEREACAKIADCGVHPIDTGRIWRSTMAADIARLIRSRGKTP